MQNKHYRGLNLTDLHKRLYAIMPELQPISTHKTGDSGTYKAIDHEGNVYEVDIWYTENTMHRRERLVMNYAVLAAQSNDAVEKRLKPHEGWNLD